MADVPAEKTPTKAGEPGSERDVRGRFVRGNPRAFAPGAPAGPGRPRKPSYGKLSAKVNAKKCSAFRWSTKLAEGLGLNPETMTIGLALIHADKRNRAIGRVGYLVEENQRTEGPVSGTEGVGNIDFALLVARLVAQHLEGESLLRFNTELEHMLTGGGNNGTNGNGNGAAQLIHAGRFTGRTA